MKRYYYSDPIAEFLGKEQDSILGSLLASNEFPLEMTQRDAWLAEIQILKSILVPYRNSGHIYFEYSIPRLGLRIDVVAVIQAVIFVLEFKVNESDFAPAAIDQVCDYALDLKNFHETSHNLPIAPILIATEAVARSLPIQLVSYHDKVLRPIKTNRADLAELLDTVLKQIPGNAILAAEWESGRYCPTPTIIEAAMSLYNGHSVAEISRSDASAVNLSQTSDAISK